MCAVLGATLERRQGNAERETSRSRVVLPFAYSRLHTLEDKGNGTTGTLLLSAGRAGH